MGQSQSSQDEEISAINVTPLVDVVLVLLVIFMMSAPFLYQNALKVQLPKVTQEGDSSQPNSLRFTVTTDGRIVWDKLTLSWTELEAKLAQAKDLGPDKAAVISADTSAEHGNVVRLMDVLRKFGLNRFALSVQNQ